MANNAISQRFKYKIEFTYLNINGGDNVQLRTECIKYVIIDYKYDKNCMPVLFANLKLDKKMVDDMILNCNKNLFAIAVYKFDDNLDSKLEVECFRQKFTYFLPDDVNTNDPIDYNDANIEEHMGETFMTVNLGLMSIDHINNNKRSCELSAKNVTIYDAVKYCTGHINDMILEPFEFNEVFDQLIVPPKNSVNKTLKYLNNYRVFYSTPYRFFQEFDHSYIISSSGRAIQKSSEVFSSVLISVKDITDPLANEEGLIVNKSTGTYEVIVNYTDVSVFDNTISNKQITTIKGISTQGSEERQLTNTADYSINKTVNVRLDNDNTNMLSNLESMSNTSNVIISITKNDLDTTLFSINKRISVHNIDRYQKFDGDYLLFEKREAFIREDNIFTLATTIFLKKL